MNRRAGWGWGAAAGLLVALVLDRWLIQRCSGHLLFHIDGAEYFYLLAMAPFEGRTTLDLLTDPHAREAFGRCCLQVADLALHGSTVPPGIALHTALEWGGLTWSSAALKGLALVYAALTMVLWLALVGGVWRSPGAAWRFAALALLGPAVFVKLNLLHWGTHEQVMLWHAAFLLLVGRGLRAAEGGPRRQGVGLLAGRAALLGVGCATLLLLNTSLLIPGLFTLVWFAAADARRRGGGRGRVALSALALIAIGGGVAGLTWWGITRIELVQSLGFQGVFWRDAKVSEALTLASFHGPWEALRSAGTGSWSLLPGLAVAGVVVAGRALGRGAVPGRPLVFLSAYLLAAWLAIAVLPVAYDQHGIWRPRFLAHLWPVSFAVLALWCSARADWLRRAVLIAVLAAGLPVQWARLDLANLQAGARYDGARLFELTYDEEGALPADRLRMAGASRDFLLGFGILRSYQTMEYWEWTPPRRAARLDHASVLEGYLVAHPPAAGGDPDEFFRGVGYGYRVLLPPARAARFDALVAAFPDREAPLRAGYSSAPLR